MKATEDTNYTDPTFNTNLAGAKANGILAGPYHFCRLDTNTAIRRQTARPKANYFLLEDQVEVSVGHIPAAVCRYRNCPSGVTKTFTSTWTDAFSDTIYDVLGVRPLIYTSQSKATDLFTSAVATDNPLWVAAWHSSGTPRRRRIRASARGPHGSSGNGAMIRLRYPSDGPINGFATWNSRGP